MSEVLGHFPCDECGSDDNLAIWVKENDDGERELTGYCFSPSCSTHISEKVLKERGLLDEELQATARGKRIRKKERISREERRALFTTTTLDTTQKDGTLYREITEDTAAFYGHRFSKGSDGNIRMVYYPETKDNKLMGYKARLLPKSFGFGNIGMTGGSNDLSGSHKFSQGGRDVIIVGGEEDKLAAFQMLRDYQKSRNNEEYDPTAVVSCTAGEGSAAAQCASNYDFLDKFSSIFICMDNDEAGREATAKIVEVLPKDKLRIMSLSGKDPSDMLQKGRHKQFVSNFFDAKPLIRDIIKTSKEADDEIELELGRPDVPLPPFLGGLAKKIRNFPLGYMITLAAGTGIGKTTIINELVYYWIFNSPVKVGILSLELNLGQYQTAMLSRHIGHKIQAIPTAEERLAFVQQDWVVKARAELRENEYGEARYILLDERDGDLEAIKKQIERLIKMYGCKLIVIDPLNDLFEGTRLEEQQAFVRYLKGVIKGGITVFSVCHITKGRTEVDKRTGKRIVRTLTEDDIAGVSNIAKSSGCTFFITRDKYAEDLIERNSSKIELGKCRWTGASGSAGEIYYCGKTHTLYDKEVYLRENGIEQQESNHQSDEIIDLDIF